MRQLLHSTWLMACVLGAMTVAGAESAERGGGAPATAPTPMVTRPLAAGPDRPDLPPRWDFARPPQEEVNKAMAFLGEYSPRRAEVVARIIRENDRGGPRFGLSRQIYMRYRELKQIEAEDPALYDLKLKQLRVEDDIFGEAAAIRAMRQEGRPTSEEQRKKLEEHRRKLETSAMEFIDLRIAERKHLITKLQAAIATDESDKRTAARQRIIREMTGNGEFLSAGAADFLRDPVATTTAP